MDVNRLSIHAARDAHKLLNEHNLSVAELCRAINQRFENLTTEDELNRLLNGDVEVPAKVLVALETVLPDYRRTMDNEIARAKLDDELADEINFM